LDFWFKNMPSGNPDVLHLMLGVDACRDVRLRDADLFSLLFFATQRSGRRGRDAVAVVAFQRHVVLWSMLLSLFARKSWL
jgi:hypothetical protein